MNLQPEVIAVITTLAAVICFLWRENNSLHKEKDSLHAEVLKREEARRTDQRESGAAIGELAKITASLSDRLASVIDWKEEGK